MAQQWAMSTRGTPNFGNKPQRKKTMQKRTIHYLTAVTLTFAIVSFSPIYVGAKTKCKKKSASGIFCIHGNGTVTDLRTGLMWTVGHSGKLKASEAKQWVEKLKTYRITLTPSVLNEAAHVMFLVAGHDKAKTLRLVLEGPYQPDVYPAQLIKPTHGQLLWLVDKDAAGCLSSSLAV